MSEKITWSFGGLAKEGFLEFGDGYRTKQSELGQPGLPILRVAEVLDGRVQPEFVDYVHNDYRHAMGNKISQPGDVVLTTKGTVGRVALIPREAPEFTYSPQVCFFRTSPNSPLLSRYLYYWLKSPEFKHQSASVKSQTDMADYINLADIRALRIIVPPVNTQRAVVKILGTLDDKIAVNGQIGNIATELLRTCYAQISKQPQRTVRLGDVIDLCYGKALKEPDRIPGSIPVFGGNGISGRHDKSLVNGPGIIVGRKGANAGSVSWSQKEFWPIDTAFYVLPRAPEVTLEFLLFALRATGLTRQVGDSAIPGLNRSIALDCEVNLPGNAEIMRFTDIAQPILKIIDQREGESWALAEMRDTLLPKLISGELRIRDAETVVVDVV
jgi:type I restriction enzyme S subunit